MLGLNYLSIRWYASWPTFAPRNVELYSLLFWVTLVQIDLSYRYQLYYTLY